MRLRPLTCVLCSIALGACRDSPAAPGSDATVVIDVPASTDIVVGDELRLIATAVGGALPLAWASSDTSVAGVTAGLVEARRPGSVRIDVTAGAASSAIDLLVVARDGGYTATEIDYFAEIAFGTEFGGATAVVRRWVRNPTIRVNGAPTAEDLSALETVIQELNALMTGAQVSLVESAAAVELHFASIADFPTILPQYVPGNIGFVWVWWDGGQVINRSVVLIATDVDLDLRRHLIREEVTQMLGLLQDSFTFPESIFYQGSSLVSEYTPVDRAVIEMLYGPHVAPGMERLAAVLGLRRATRTMVAPPLAAPARIPEVLGQPGSGGSGRRGAFLSPAPSDTSSYPLEICFT